MLVLTRRIGETIVIGGGIRLTVVALEGGKVRLGIAAPEAVEVHREEVHKRIRRSLAQEPLDQPEVPAANAS